MIDEKDLSLLSNWRSFASLTDPLYSHIVSQALILLRKRENEIGALKTPSQWRQRQEWVKEKLIEVVGRFPEKTELNPRTTGVVKKDGFRVEKVIYESMPGFFVTAGLFVPDRLSERAPGIIYSCGHTEDGFRIPAYQTAIINLVKKGFVVLAYDPIGQGERLQYFDPSKSASTIGGPTHEHSYAGAQCFMIGSSLARYRIWDGIRSIDYLMTRDEVDPQKIGMTGRSGGGTLTAYVSAFDDRVLASAPECYICGFKRLLQSIGPQDAEQNLIHAIKVGIDHADLLEVRAPKPCLIIATTRDMFSIQGTREVFEEVRSAYKAFGKEENLQMVEDDAPHQSTRKNREAMYAFFQKYLCLPGPPDDQPVELLSPDELRVTQTGQISTSIKSKTVFDVNMVEANRLLIRLKKARKDPKKHISLTKKFAQKLSGYVQPSTPEDTIFAGRHKLEDFSIEKYIIKGEGNYMLPMIMLLPSKSSRPLLYLNPEGKRCLTLADNNLRELVEKGFSVIIPDLLGIGELSTDFKGDSYMSHSSYGLWFGSMLIGRSILGMRVSDTIRIIKFLQTQRDMDCSNISAVAFNELCPVLLHASAFDDSIAQTLLINPLISYFPLVTNRYYEPKFVHSAVACSLKHYDLIDLAMCIAPRKLIMSSIVDQNGKPIPLETVEEDLQFIRNAFDTFSAGEMFVLCKSESEAFDNLT